MSSETTVKVKQAASQIPGIEAGMSSIKTQMEILDEATVLETAAETTLQNMPLPQHKAPQVGGLPGLVQPAWTVRASYSGNVDGCTAFSAKAYYEIYKPVCYSNGREWNVEGGETVANSEWRKLSGALDPGKSNGTLMAKFTLNIAKDDEGKETKTLTKVELALVTGNSTPDSNTVYIPICEFYATGLNSFEQVHSGILTFTGETSNAGGAAVIAEDQSVYIYQYDSDQSVWLVQGKQTQEVTGGDGTTAKIEIPKTKILRLDNLIYKTHMVSQDSNYSECACSCALGVSPACWGLTACTFKTAVSIEGFDTKEVQGSGTTEGLSQVLLRGWKFNSVAEFCTAYPADETQQGWLSGNSQEGYLFSTDAPSQAGCTVLFYTELMDVNNAGTYSAARTSKDDN